MYYVATDKMGIYYGPVAEGKEEELKSTYSDITFLKDKSSVKRKVEAFWQKRGYADYRFPEDW